MPTNVQLPVPITRRLDEAIDPWCAANDYEELRRLALGAEPADLRTRAIVALAASDDPSRIRDLARILGDAATPPRWRALAAQLLGRADCDSARATLLSALKVPDPRLVGPIVQSLGRIGDRAAFKPIVKASSGLTGPPLLQARFALRLIAYRFDLELPDWPDEEGTLLPDPGEEGSRFTVQTADPIEAQIAVRSLAGDSYGIELNEGLAYAIRCDGSRLMLLFDAGLTDAREGRALMARKRIAAIVGRHNEAAGLYAVSLVMLTTPLGNQETLDVAVYQPNGTLALKGSGHPRDQALAFAIRGVARRGGFAVTIDGTVEGATIRLSKARAGHTRVGAGRPHPRPHS